jgi:hypothetical protein
MLRLRFSKKLRSPQRSGAKKSKSLDLKKFLTATQIKSLKREAKKVMNGSLSLTKFKSLIRKMISSRSRSLGLKLKLKGGNFFTDAISYILSFFGFESMSDEDHVDEEDEEYEGGSRISYQQNKINRRRRGSM